MSDPMLTELERLYNDNDRLRAQVEELRPLIKEFVRVYDEGTLSEWSRAIARARAILAKMLPTDDWHDPFFVKLRQSKTEDK